MAIRNKTELRVQEPVQEIDLRELLSALWRGRWLIAVFACAFTSASAVYAFTAPIWFKAETSLTPAEKKSLNSGLSQLGGLASLAGISLPTSEGAEPIAVLKSKGLIRDFITDENLLPILLSEQWDLATKSWKRKGSEAPDIRDGVKYFDEHVRSVVEDKKSGLVTLSIRWHDADSAARWANALARRVNSRLRAQAIQEAQTSIDYLREEMARTSVISLQQSIGHVLEGQMQALALARSNEEFAFRVVDSATPPRIPAEPKRQWILGGGLVGGFVFGCFLAVMCGSRRNMPVIR